MTWKILNKRLFHASNKRFMQLPDHRTSTCALIRHAKHTASKIKPQSNFGTRGKSSKFPCALSKGLPRDSAMTPAQGSTGSHIQCPGSLARLRTPLGNRRSRRAAPARSLMVPAQVCYEAHQFLEYPIRQAQNKEQNFKLRFGHSFASDSPLASTAQTCSINSALTSLSFFFPATGVRIRWAQLCASSTASCAPSSHGHRHKSRRMSTFPFLPPLHWNV